MKPNALIFLTALVLCAGLAASLPAFAEESTSPDPALSERAPSERAPSGPATPAAIASQAELASTVAASPTTATCLAGLLQQATLPEDARLSPLGPELLVVPTHPCFRPPPPPSSCLCGGCCENCRCWHSGTLAKCTLD